MSRRLPVHRFKWMEETSQFNEDFLKNYNEESSEGYFLAVDVQYPEQLHELHNDLPFLPETMKIKKFEKLVTNLHDKTWKNLEKVRRVIEFNQKAWLKPYIDMNTKVRQRAKNNFEKDFFKLMKM